MIRRTCALAAILCLASSAVCGQVLFTISASQNVQAISPYIYGSNDPVIVNRTIDRNGGNRWTAYNWENNASNAGSDYLYQNDNYLVQNDPPQLQNTPGEAVLPSIQAAAQAGRAILQTIPMAGYVAADKNGGGDIRNTLNYQQTRLKQIVNLKGSPFTFTPSTSDAYVYTDEFVNWIEHAARVNSQQQIFYDLDNEPDLWSSTHPEVHAQAATYAELIQKSLDTASAIKSVAPNALVFGGVNYGWGGYTTLQGASDQSTDSTITTKTLLNFQAAFLKQMHAADVAAGHRLVDVLDMHWYPEARGGGSRIALEAGSNDPSNTGLVAARVQAARSLWDPTYVYSTNPATGEDSWITRDSLPYQPSGTPSPFNNTAIQLLPREKWLINQYNPGTKLSISEYSYGGGADISGGVAEADVLGVFGQQGVFSANWWPDGSSAQFTNSAFNMYLNYDGRGSNFGNTSIQASTNSIATTAAYASQDAGNPNRMVLVLINRTGSPVTSTLNIANSSTLSLVDAYQLTAASSSISHVVYNSASPQWQWLGANQLSYNLPAMSVTTLALVKSRLGDFNLDGAVTNADLQAMLVALASPSAYETAHNLTDANLLALGDFNSDGAVNVADLAPMTRYLATGQLGVSASAGPTQTVPEPPSILLLILGAAMLLPGIHSLGRWQSL